MRRRPLELAIDQEKRREGRTSGFRFERWSSRACPCMRAHASSLRIRQEGVSDVQNISCSKDEAHNEESNPNSAHDRDGERQSGSGGAGEPRRPTMTLRTLCPFSCLMTGTLHRGLTFCLREQSQRMPQWRASSCQLAASTSVCVPSQEELLTEADSSPCHSRRPSRRSGRGSLG